MANSQLRGPMGTSTHWQVIDSGTMCLVASPLAGTLGTGQREDEVFERAMDALRADVANLGAHLALDASARSAYAQLIGRMSEELRNEVARRHMTWAQAAEQAQVARNAIMETIRARSTPVGRAMAESLKSQGKTLNELIARKTLQLYGNSAVFSKLSVDKQNAVYAEIVQSAGRSNPRVTSNMQRLSRAGRGLLILSLAISVYNVASSEDKAGTARHEVAITGAGIAGGVAGGALAGLACGPGAPVCVTVGAFVGGALAALGVDALW